MTTIQTAAASSATLPSSTAANASNPSHAHTSMQGGQAVFENDHYRITAGDNNQVLITNKQTGSTYMAAGDPHMYVNGQHVFDFWGTTTLKLDDGTKVTIETTPWGNNPAATLSSKVTITNGDYGVEITGVDTNTVGDLKINEAAGWGNTLDWAHDDGNVLMENAAGNNLVAFGADGKLKTVDQAYINATDLVKNPGRDAQLQQLENLFQDAFKSLSGLISISLTGAFMGAVLAAAAQGSNGNQTRPTQQHNDEGQAKPRTPDVALRDLLSFTMTLLRGAL